MTDIDGNEVNVGDTVTVLAIRDNIQKSLAADEKPHVMAMLGNSYEIDEFVNDGTQVSLTICIQEPQGCMFCGLYLFPHEFRLVSKSP
ncbi:hypothetical protein [Viridibacterium curvum]|uniref:Uncharacterized protein n=1 Tax=Viridibacterium curvum TaxID=1101404 RepID=A0ABP9QV13_9RHOO